MVKSVLIALALTLFVIGPVAAESQLDKLTDTLTGKNDSIVTILDVEILKEFKDVKGTDIQVGIGYEGNIRRLTNDNVFKYVARVIF